MQEFFPLSNFQLHSFRTIFPARGACTDNTAKFFAAASRLQQSELGSSGITCIVPFLQLRGGRLSMNAPRICAASRSGVQVGAKAVLRSTRIRIFLRVPWGCADGERARCC